MWLASEPLLQSLASVLGMPCYVPPSCDIGAIQHSMSSDIWSLRYYVRAWGAESWTGRASCLCHCVGQCKVSPCHPGQRVVQYQPRIPECLPFTILPFPQPIRGVLLFMALEGLWPPTLHQGKSLQAMELACDDIGVSMNPAYQELFPTLPGQGECGLLWGWNPVAWPSTSTWC